MMEAMRCCGFFESLDEAALIRLRPAAKRVIQPRGTVVFNEGEPCRGFYIVESGAVKIYKESPDAREHVLHVAVPGDCFGEAALFLGMGYPASAAAVQESSLILLRRDEFLEIIKQDPEVSLRLMASMATWSHRLVMSIEALTLKDASARFASYVLSKAQADPRPTGDIDLGMPKQVLASHLGMTGETLSRILARLETDEVIETRGKRVAILVPEELQEIAEFGRA
jgi:CRP/FNR family transcriptional regulator, dissimilatory nitrate respiration regulator